MKLFLYTLFILLIYTSSTEAGKWSKPIVMGKTKDLPAIIDVDYDSLYNIYVSTFYSNWISKDGDTLIPIEILEDNNHFYKYQIYERGNGLKDAVDPYTEYSEKGYITKYNQDLLFVRNDSIYRLNDYLEDLDSLTIYYIYNLGNDNWCFVGKKFVLTTISFPGFIFFNSDNFTFDIIKSENSGGFPLSNTNGIYHYNKKYWYLAIKEKLSIASFDKQGHNNYYVIDSINKLEENFWQSLNINDIYEIRDKIHFCSPISTNIYSFNLNTLEVGLEDKLEWHPEIVENEKENMETYNVTGFHSNGSCDIYDIRFVMFTDGKSIDEQKSSLYYKSKDSNTYTYLERKNPPYSYIGSLFKVTPDSLMWFGVIIYPDGNQAAPAYRGIIAYDPFATDTDVVESIPSLVTFNAIPNPAQTYTDVSFYLHPESKGKTSFSIYNYIGELVSKLDNNFEYDPTTAIALKRINTMDMKKGIYYLVIDNGIEKKSQDL
jgi:hypothetical protein